MQPFLRGCRFCLGEPFLVMDIVDNFGCPYLSEKQLQISDMGSGMRHSVLPADLLRAAAFVSSCRLLGGRGHRNYKRSSAPQRLVARC